jgi:shikimate kinase
VIGAGGAARAAIAAARRLGATPVVLARNAERIAALGAEVARDAADAASRAPAIVIDATPAGPPGGTAVFDPAALPQPAIVLDMLVHAAPTALLDAAARAGHRTVAGFELLLAQAAHQVVRLGGEAPHRDRMRRAGEAALARRDAPIVLVGLRGAGKTTVGRLLADLLGRPFVDSDDEACVRGAAPVDEILRTRGEPLFRGIEGEVLRDLARRPGTVVATGGGAALHREAFGALAAAGVVVLLDAPDDVLLARAAAAPRLPLTPLAPAAEIAAQRAERMPLYRAAASLSVDVAATDARAAAERIAAWWDERSLPEMPISVVEGT